MCPTPERRIVVRAPAKVNLYLAIGGLRDDGYHDLETVFQSISLADEILIEPAEALSVTTEPDLGLPQSANLAYRAARALGKAAGCEPAVAIRIDKRIPHGAGLGGASADAAGVLAGLARLWGLGSGSAALLHEVASGLGADVPFLLDGGTALCSGKGEVRERDLPTPPLEFAVVRPDVPVPTADAYRAFDRLGAGRAPDPGAMVAACEAGDAVLVARALFNNMTEAALSLVPEVADALASLQQAEGVLGVAMSGSGSAAFGIFESAEAAGRAAVAARQQGLWGAVARSEGAGVTVTEGA